MSIKRNVSVMFIPAIKGQGFNFTKAPAFDQPAHWCVCIDFIEDNNPMSASMHQYAFVCKPTDKQLRKCKRKALAEHVSDLIQFKQNYEQYFK